jgi:hypothetical protein
MTQRSPFNSLRPVLLLLPLLLAIGLLAFRIEIALPATPNLNNTLTPETTPTAQEVGSYDVLGQAVSKAKAQELFQNPVGREQLTPENGAVQITQKLIDRGRRAFYGETFGDEIFQSEVVGALDGPLNSSEFDPSNFEARRQTDNQSASAD